MNILPWRVKAFASNHLPLAYHLLANLHTRRRSAEYWDTRLAESWDQRHWPAKNALIARLTSPGDHILDIACGNGGILKHLQSLGYRRLEGLEISGYAVERLRAEGLTMHRGSVPTLPLPDAEYDVVIASQVLEHVIRRHHFAREIARILKDEGYISDYSVDTSAAHPRIKITNKIVNRSSAIAGLRRVSRPGLRRYVGADEIPRVLGGMGLAILSTSRGVLSGREARKQKVGGELLAYVW